MESFSMPGTVEEVFDDYRGRRAGIIKALTTEVEDFYNQCDPDKENLCLYGFPEEAWEVNLPAEEVPPELPEPALGINFARDGMGRRDWLSLVAVHSDAWLFAVSFYYCARFNKQDRNCLFNMINELPTIYEVVTGRNTVKEKSPINNGSFNPKSSTKREKPFKQASKPAREEEDTFEDDEEEHGDTFCGACRAAYTGDEFWIACDVCEKWFHGRCVKITPAKAAQIKQYKCPFCSSNKRAHP